MKVQLLKDCKLAVDGFTVKDQKEGDELTVDDEMGAALVRDDLAVEVEVEQTEETTKHKTKKRR